jgi:hypothetical protein
VLADRVDAPAPFLIQGSDSPDPVKSVSESLALRAGSRDLSGFDGAEVGFDHLDTLWLRGGLPESFQSGQGGRARTSARAPIAAPSSTTAELANRPRTTCVLTPWMA